jgi:hypothetical protein
MLTIIAFFAKSAASELESGPADVRYRIVALSNASRIHDQ